jgi:choline dehydrogenase-like flavoprotein
LGNDSGALGHYLIGHNYRGRVTGEYDGFRDQYYSGRRPTSTYVPRFRNFGKDKQTNFIRGYSYSGFGSRSGWARGTGSSGFGAAFKESLTQPGPWRFGLNGMGEFLPRFENHASLHPDQVDAWGVPTLKISCDYGPNEEAMLQDIMTTAAEMMEGAGLKVISVTDTKQAPGNENHEMGTARMGKDPKTSVLNKWNQVHAVPNVFVTDGACMASSACQNPSLTYMALTARAADHAVQELKRMNL